MKWKFILLTQALDCHLLCYSCPSHKLRGWSVCVWNPGVLPRSRQRQKRASAGWRLRDNAVCHPAELTGVQPKPGTCIRTNGRAGKVLPSRLAPIFGSKWQVWHICGIYLDYILCPWSFMKSSYIRPHA